MACAPAFVKTRGKRVPLGAILAHDGIIPAHAGKTYPSRVTAFTLGDHPRSRGENNAVPLTAARASGSSPLTRGKPGVGSEAGDLLRLIPAHAGKTR